MNLQIIKSIDGRAEYVLLPVTIYQALHEQIGDKLKRSQSNDDYVPFDVADYVDNPVALARIKARLTQEQLAKLMGVSQAYISKIERQKQVTAKLLAKLQKILAKAHKAK